MNKKELGWMKEQGVKIGCNVKIDNSLELNCESLEIGDYSQIDAFTFLSGNIKIGKFTEIGVHSTLSGGNGITIGSCCAISPYGYLFTNSADFHNETLSLPTVPKRYKRKFDTGRIKINNHVIVGAGSKIFPGSTIQTGCKFGANSIIKGDYDAWALYVSKGNKIATLSKKLKGYTILTDYATLIAELS